MKIVFLLATTFFLIQPSFSQWPGNENPLTIQELKLTRLQQKRIRKINSDAASEIHVLEKSGPVNEETTIKIAKVRGRRIKRIRSCLTPGQQVTWKEKLAENKPRRGVTGLPNEKR